MKRPLFAVLVLAAIIGVVVLQRLAEKPMATAPSTSANQAPIATGPERADPHVEREYASPASVRPTFSASPGGSAVAPPALTPPLPKPAVVTQLFQGDALDGSAAFKVVSSPDFDTLMAHLQQESSPETQELERLYETQFAELTTDTDTTLRRLHCGDRLCAAEFVRPLGTATPDPFSRPDLDQTLPRDARVEINFADHDEIVRRFLFSIDPNVTSLRTAQKP